MTKRTYKLKLEKVVISTGLGQRESAAVELARDHFSQIMNRFLTHKRNDQIVKTAKVVTTKCHRPCATFKTKKNKPMGFKITLRKDRMIEFIRYLLEQVKDLESRLKFNNNTFFMGLKDHRLLKLERYNYKAPNYGFNIALVINTKTSHIYDRRFNKSVKPLLDQTLCKDFMKTYINDINQ
jgi:ribosomal protein L5